jgi:hypothetical protein
MKLHRLSFVAFVLGIILVCGQAQSQTGTNPKSVRIRLLIEPENLKSGVSGRGGEDLSTAEMTQLRSLLSTEIGKSHMLASVDDKDAPIALSVVAEKIRSGQQTWFVLSTVLTVASTDRKIEEFLTHDVVAETSPHPSVIV